MNLTDYQPLALRTEKPLPTSSARLEHAALGLITETGEIATCVKRMAIYGKTLDDLDKSTPPKTIRQNIEEEVGDVLWYLAIAASALETPTFVHLDGMVQRSGQDLKSAVLNLSANVGHISSKMSWDASGEVSPDVFDLPAALAGIAHELVDIAGLIGVPLETIAADNIAKLRERFPAAYSNEAAEARADKGGADARNS